MAGSGVSRDEFIDNLAIEILGKIPPEYDMVKIKRNFGVSVSPTTIVLFQELERFNKLIKRMRTTLEQLRKVTILMLSLLLTTFTKFIRTLGSGW